MNLNWTAVAVSVVLLIGTSVFLMLVKRLLLATLAKIDMRAPRDITQARALMVTRMLTSSVWIIVAVVLLEMWGVGVGGLWALLVSIAALVGVGFLATWSIASNVTASFLVAVAKPFQLGDMVEVLPEGLKGRVVDRTLMFVVLRDESGALLHVPSSVFFQKVCRVTGQDMELGADPKSSSRNESID